jgi:hypothetical protein
MSSRVRLGRGIKARYSLMQPFTGMLRFESQAWNPSLLLRRAVMQRALPRGHDSQGGMYEIDSMEHSAGSRPRIATGQ